MDDILAGILSEPLGAWVAEDSLNRMARGVPLPHSMNPEDLPQGQMRSDLLSAMQIVRGQTFSSWRGLDVRHTQQASTSYSQFDLFAALDYAANAGLLSQSAFDFLTLRDFPSRRLEIIVHEDAMDQYDNAMVSLAVAFRAQCLTDAAAHLHRLVPGAYWLNKPPLDTFNSFFEYESVRFVVNTSGMAITIVGKDGAYIPFFWYGPESTQFVWFGNKALAAIDIFCAALWRDLCVVKEGAFIPQEGRRGYTPKGTASTTRPREKVIVLPRVVNRYEWGSSADRQAIERSPVKPHTVIHCYPRLPDGHVAHDAAERAAEWGCLPPPLGHTFRAPHQRGTGEVKSGATRIVARGLQTAMALLG
jgi:hypothetical protein